MVFTTHSHGQHDGMLFMLCAADWTLNNLMACLIVTDILQLVGLRSFRVAGLLLMGLLAYDVFWVSVSVLLRAAVPALMLLAYDVF
jgi:hypothetical protein